MRPVTACHQLTTGVAIRHICYVPSRRMARPLTYLEYTRQVHVGEVASAVGTSAGAAAVGVASQLTWHLCQLAHRPAADMPPAGGGAAAAAADAVNPSCLQRLPCPLYHQQPKLLLIPQRLQTRAVAAAAAAAAAAAFAASLAPEEGNE